MTFIGYVASFHERKIFLALNQIKCNKISVESVARYLYVFEHVLVHIMKVLKTILHQALIPQIMDHIKVSTTAASLIEREYLERDDKDRNRYNYLA